MIAGCSVIATDVPPIRWALADTGLLIPPRDEGALLEALKALTDAAARNALRERSFDRALKLFTPEAVGPQFDELLNGCVSWRC
jgi:glycosyltransferase involved in cell wall biosynthesis